MSVKKRPEIKDPVAKAMIPLKPRRWLNIGRLMSQIKATQRANEEIMNRIKAESVVKNPIYSIESLRNYEHPHFNLAETELSLQGNCESDQIHSETKVLENSSEKDIVLEDMKSKIGKDAKSLKEIPSIEEILNGFKRRVQ